MTADPLATTRYARFRDALLDAVTEGKFPSGSCDLTAQTRAIIHAIADRHPEANPTLIADAYDAFDRASEQWRVGDAAPNC